MQYTRLGNTGLIISLAFIWRHDLRPGPGNDGLGFENRREERN